MKVWTLTTESPNGDVTTGVVTSVTDLSELFTATLAGWVEDERLDASLLPDEWEALARETGFLTVEIVEHDIAMTPRVEILHVRDPDGPCDHTVFLNGVELRWRFVAEERTTRAFHGDDPAVFYVEDVDAGGGGTRADWNDHTAHVANTDRYSEEFKAAVVAAREDPPGSDYIEEED